MSVELTRVITNDQHEVKNSKSLTEMLSSNLAQENSRGTLLACKDDKYISVYNLGMEEPRYRFSVDLVKGVQEFTFLSRTQMVISCYETKQVVVWDLDLNRATQTVNTLGRKLRVSGKYCIMYDAQTLKVWDTESGKLLEHPTDMTVLDLKIHNEEFISLHVDSEIITIGTWDTATLENRKLIPIDHNQITPSPWRVGLTPLFLSSNPPLLCSIDADFDIVLSSIREYYCAGFVTQIDEQRCVIVEPGFGEHKLNLFNIRTQEEELRVRCSGYAVAGTTIMYTVEGIVHVLEVTPHGKNEKSFANDMKQGAIWME